MLYLITSIIQLVFSGGLLLITSIEMKSRKPAERTSHLRTLFYLSALLTAAALWSLINLLLTGA